LEGITDLDQVDVVRTRDHQKEAPDTSDLTIKGREVEPGFIGVYDFISGYDETTANKRIRLQVVVGSEILTLKDQTVATTDRSLDIQTRILVPEGGYIQAVIVGPTKSDVCHLAYSGHWARTE